MTNRIEVTPEQLASLLLINIAITDLLEQGAHADILEELDMLQPDLQNIVAPIKGDNSTMKIINIENQTIGMSKEEFLTKFFRLSPDKQRELYNYLIQLYEHQQCGSCEEMPK